MAQFYTKERSVQGASPQIYDDSQRILTEAENIIESMRAVSSIEEQQNATLINNLRAHRQREKELNTRNHQMLMDNMKQVAEAQQRKDQIALNNKNLKRQEDIAQDQRTMQTLATLSQAAGKYAGAMVEDGIKQETEKARLEATTSQELNPQATAGQALGLSAHLNEDARVEQAQATAASLAQKSGKDLNFIQRLFISPDRVQRIRQQVFAGEMAKKIATRGFLEDHIRQNPDETVTFTDPFTQETKTTTLGQVLTRDGIQSSEVLNRIYSEVAHKLMAPFKGEADPILFQEADETVRNFINTRSLQFGEKLSRDAILENEKLRIKDILLADSPEKMATNVITFTDQAGLSPFTDRGTALNQVTNDILPNTPSPINFAEAMGEREFRHMPGIKIKDTPFGRNLLREAKRLQTQKDTDYIAEQDAIGSKAGNDLFKASFGNDRLFDIAEYNASYNAVREKEENGTITFEAARKAENILDSKYETFSDSKLANELIADLSERQELTQESLDSAFQAGHIDRELYDSETKKIKALDKVTLPNGLRYSQKTIRAQALIIATDAVGRFDVSGLPTHYSATAAADLAADMYLEKFKEYSTEFTPDQAASKAWADIQAKMINREGEFFIDKNDKGRGNIYSRLTVGDHTGALRVPAKSTNTANQVGLSLRGDGVNFLDDKDWTELDHNMKFYGEQINNGKQIKPTAFDQEVADAAGIPLYEVLNRRFKALGINAEAKEGSFDILKKNVYEISPELKRVINSPKTWNKLSSVTDRSPNLLPARMGNQSLGFHNATSIARKFQHPNPEIIGALWSLQTDEGRTQPNLTPAQQISQLIENNPELNMFIPYADIASTAPQVAVVMQKHGDSHSTFSGASKSISRLQTVALRQPLPEGALQGLTYADIKEAVFGASGEAVHGTKDVPLVIASILNRVADPRYPNTVQEVINEDGQYEAVYEGNSRYMPELETYYSSPQGQQDIADAFNALQGRTDYKGQSQLKNRGEGDVMGDPTGNFFHYANQTGYGPYTGEVPTHYQQYLR